MIFIGINKNGVMDVAIQAKNSEDTRELTMLYQNIEPEIKEFAKTINEKLTIEDDIIPKSANGEIVQ